jgi:DNA-binding CsgD family transcriptional regulator
MNILDLSFSPFLPGAGEDQLWAELSARAGRAYGVTSMLYAFTHSKYTVARTGIMPSIYFRHDHPADFIATYGNSLTLEDSVAAQLILKGETCLFWRDFPAMDLTPKQRARIAKDEACGMGVGVSFGFRFGANSGYAALCWAARDADAQEFKSLIQAKRAEIDRIGAEFDRLMRPAMIANRIRLTPREKDVLSYSAGGMTAKQIAAHLGLSQKTIAHTLERARNSLGAVSTMEAVAKALVYELIV